MNSSEPLFFKLLSIFWFNSFVIFLLSFCWIISPSCEFFIWFLLVEMILVIFIISFSSWTFLLQFLSLGQILLVSLLYHVSLQCFSLSFVLNSQEIILNSWEQFYFFTEHFSFLFLSQVHEWIVTLSLLIEWDNCCFITIFTWGWLMNCFRKICDINVMFLSLLQGFLAIVSLSLCPDPSLMFHIWYFIPCQLSVLYNGCYNNSYILCFYLGCSWSGCVVLEYFLIFLIGQSLFYLSFIFWIVIISSLIFLIISSLFFSCWNELFWDQYFYCFSFVFFFIFSCIVSFS